MLSRLLRAKVVAAVALGTVAVGTAAAAATGNLPDAAQARAHNIVDAVPDAGPAGHGAAVVQTATHAPGAGGASDHPAVPGAAGLCQAYGSGSGGESGKKLDSTAFGRLADAAGGADKIAAYCTKVTAATHPAGSAATGDRTTLAGACRSWQEADRAGRTPAAAVLDRLTAAAGGVEAIRPFCTALVDTSKGSGDSGRPSATPSHPAPPTPPGGAPTAPPGDGHGQGSPSHPAPPTPRG